jgi:hypothetical protein
MTAVGRGAGPTTTRATTTAAPAVGRKTMGARITVVRVPARMTATIPAPAPTMMVTTTVVQTMATMTTIAAVVVTTIPATMMITVGQAMAETRTMIIAAQGVVEMTKPGPPSLSLRCLPT